MYSEKGGAERVKANFRLVLGFFEA